jgi:hypothetical protein
MSFGIFKRATPVDKWLILEKKGHPMERILEESGVLTHGGWIKPHDL